MDSLNPETIREIVYYLEDKSDIARFRLVQRAFAELGREFIFNCLYVQPSQHSLSRLLEIARHPSCARYVRTVALSVDAMKVMVWRPFSEQIGSKNLNDLDYRTLFIFRTLANECQEFQKSSDYAAMLSASFSRFPRLSTISLREVSPWTSPHSEAVTLMDRYAYTVDPPHFHGSWGERDHLRAFSALIDATHFAGTTLKSFTTNGLIDQALFDNRRLLSRAASVFRSCRVLKLLFCGEEPSPTVCGHPVTPRLLANPLLDVLSPAIELEELTIEFSSCPSAGRGGELFTKIFGTQHRWLMLREVNLGAIDLPYEELLAFLNRHKATLRGFTTSCCDLVNGSWLDVMVFLKDNMMLKRLELDDSLADEFRKDYSSKDVEMMVNYVLYGGEHLPGRSWLDRRQLPRNTTNVGP